MENSNRFAGIQEKFISLASKIGNQRHMVAIRDGFTISMSALIVGSVASLVNSFPIPAFQTFMKNTFGANWTLPGAMIYNMTLGVIGLWVVVGIAYYLGRSYKLDGLSSSFIAAITFLIFTPITAANKVGAVGIDLNWLGTKGLFLSVIVGLLSTEAYRFISKRGWTIKMPDGVPPAVEKGFASLTPSFIILIVSGLASGIISNVTNGSSITQIVYNAIQVPFQNIGNSIWAVELLYLMRGGLWFFGLHGTNVMSPVTNAITLPNMTSNIAQFSHGVSAYNVDKIVTSSFGDVFVSIGGTGVGLAFVIAVIIASRIKSTRTLVIGATPAALFNINEPLLYGTPIVLNASLLIPFLLAPAVNIMIAYSVMAIKLVPRTVALVPWNMPVGFGGYLATGGDIRGAILQIILLAVAVVIYLPFIKLNDRVMLRNNPELEMTELTK